MDGSFMNQNNQNNPNAENSQSQQPNQQPMQGQGFVMGPSPAQEAQNGGNGQPFGEAGMNIGPDGNPIPEPAPKKPRKKMPLWLSRAIFAVLIAALAVGGGYLGTSLAYQQVDRVVVQRVETAAETGGEPAAEEGALNAKQIAQQCEPSVVAIVTERMTTNNFWYGTQVSGGAGSGEVK